MRLYGGDTSNFFKVPFLVCLIMKKQTPDKKYPEKLSRKLNPLESPSLSSNVQKT